MPSTITFDQVQSDLQRLPPPFLPPSSSSSPPTTTVATKPSSSTRDLGLVLLWISCQEILSLLQESQLHDEGEDEELREEQGADLEERIRAMEDEIATSNAKLAAAVEGVASGRRSDSSSRNDHEEDEDFRMEHVLDEEDLEDDDKDVTTLKALYLRTLMDHRVVPYTVKVPVSSPDCVRNTTSTANNGKQDESDHQAMRDIERDSLLVNGTSYKAGLGGYGRVLAWLNDIMLGQLDACRVTSRSSPSSSDKETKALEAFAKDVLKKINRTNSAGLAYDILSRRLGKEGVTTIVPDSKAAEPLQIDLDVGAFPLPRRSSSVHAAAAAGRGKTRTPPRGRGGMQQEQPHVRQWQQGGGWAWGIRARLQTATSYDVYDEAVEDKWISIRAEFRECVCLPVISPSPPSVGGARGEASSLGASIRLTEKK